MKHSLRLTVAALCGAPLVVSLPVLAQQGANEIEEVVVTARKRSESLQEVPIAITAFTEETIDKAGIERPADFISLMPNVTIVDTANVGDTQVSIRGIVSTRDAESTFAYVVDGILSTNPNSFNEELVDVQQIEVLKGPQGALYGRNAVAGAILVTTKEPGEEFDGELSVGGGNNGLAKATVKLSGPIGGSARGSIAASYRDFDGFYDNIFEGAGSGVDYLEDTTIRGRLLWDLSDRARLDLRASRSEVEGGAINFNAAFAIPAFAAAFGSETFFQDVNDLDFRYTFNVPGENQQETTEIAARLDYDTDIGDFSVTATFNDLDEYLLSDGTSATFYGYELTPACQNDRTTLNNTPGALGGADRTDLYGPFFQPFGIFPSSGNPPDPNLDFAGVYGPYTPTSCDGFQYQERNQRDTGIEFRLTSPQDQPVRWIAGLYGAEIEREVVVAYGADQGQGFLRTPYVAPSGPNPTDLLFWDEFETTVFAVFGELSFDMGDTMELSLALRYDNEDRDVSNRVPAATASGLNLNTLDQTTFQPGPINPAFNANLDPIPARSADFDQLQPKVTWRWSANDNVNAYASYGIGFRSGGFNSIGSEALLNFWFNSGFGGPGDLVDAQLQISDEYDKEVSKALEFGVKTEWLDRRLRVNAAVFNTDIDDNQFFEFFAGPFGLLRVVTTIEEAEVQGFEADFSWLATESWSVYGGIGLLDSEIERNDNRPLSVGNDLPQAPDTTWNLGTQFVMPFGGDKEFFIRADYQHVGETWFHTLQGEQTPTIWQVFFGPGINQDFSRARRDDYGTLALRAGIDAENWSLAVWGRNITDEEYLEEVIPAPEFGGSFNHQGMADAYGAEFTYRF